MRLSFLGIILILVVAVGFIYYLIAALPKSREIESQKPQIEKIDRNILKSDTVSAVRSLEVNGQVPVQVSPDEIGRDDPFANF